MKNNVLITAYAVDPYKGSKDDTGWNIISALSKNQAVLAITRLNNRASIKGYRIENRLVIT